MTTRKKPMSARTQLRLGREFQERFDHGDSWAAIATDYDLSKSMVQRLARTYRDDCDRRAHQNQMTLFN
ncbi:hypothetical protein H0264_28865 [Nocardia huaxiensis]|uniref:Uncharacterized protein n=1 Tax=Nocardia huaxiensis TaxID=2755382 RepID=A0A7D6VA06_9NOCA|nr:hypothetical protein [Nocardia huaxiensis]QLY29262.1 hypothetical protein H0264_28865 [Nocardia huaxiensis]